MSTWNRLDLQNTRISTDYYAQTIERSGRCGKPIILQEVPVSPISAVHVAKEVEDGVILHYFDSIAHLPGPK